MSSHSFVRALLVSTAFVSAGFATPALAQLAPPAPVRQSVDSNGVDLFLGTMSINAPAISMGGAAPQGLSYYQLFRGSAWTDNIIATLNISGSNVTISFGGTSDSFTLSGSTYTSTEGNGATLSLSGTTYTYTAADGTVARFTSTKTGTYPFYANGGRVMDITRPSGQKLTFNYDNLYYCSNYKPYVCIGHSYAYRISSVSNNYGYAIGFGYALDNNDIDPDQLSDFSQLASWGTVTSATMSNLAASSGSSAPTEDVSNVTSGGTTYFQVTDAMGRATKYRTGAYVLMGITRPGSASEDVTLAYTAGRISSVATPAGTTTYSSSDASGVRTVTVTDALSHATVYTFDIASQRMTSRTDALSHTTSLQYDTSARVTRITKPEGDYTQITYDVRGNVTERRKVAKSGSGVADIVTSAVFPSTCTNIATCNEQTSTTDARGNVTDYIYDSTTGLVTSVTAPAPTAGATRPQTRYSYTALQAYYNIGTSIVASGQPVTLLTGTSTCQTTASCTGMADEVVSSTSYGPQTTGVGNNLLPVSTSSGAGNGSLTATTALNYDTVGNLISVDGPLSGSDDTTIYRYDADRERVGVISPDPDGAGSMKRRAVRTTYNAHGIATETEIGTVNSTSDADWAGFTSLQQKTITLDAADRPVATTLTAGGSAYQVTQQSFDAAGKPECTALRMNSAAWGSLPSSACTLGTAGSYGSDRITKTTYDAANRRTYVQTAYGTSDQANDATVTYNNNGTLAALTDGEGNKTSYVYDGVDRLSQMFYPSTTAGSGTSSTTDYEQLTYDAAGHVTSRRLRDGNSIGYTYDADGRLTYKNLPTGEYDVTYAYDLLDRPTSAGTSLQTLTFGYDALSRITSQGGPLGTVGAQFDLAGRRTRLTWPDSFYVTYDYLVTGEVSAIRENGAASGIGVLAAYAYDDLGRRTTLTRGNGTSSGFGYDNASRLTSLALNLDSAGTTNDLTLGFGYSPANQITSTMRSNNLYSWGGAADRNDASSVNGLNQTTTVGAGSIGYDSKGNLNSTGSNSYAYSSENLLLSGPSSASLAYDPLLRLYQESSSSVAGALFQYDGRAMIGEYNSSLVMLKRYVTGPGTDEPLVEYDKSGGSYARTWLHADERGSIIAQSNDSGATTTINSYDEYGVPAIGNVGRFQYTGQVWLPSIAMYYYKARIYSSRLGRFMQSDPIGYGDGNNLYNYVAGDPINWDDPSGTKASITMTSNGDGTYSWTSSDGNAGTWDPQTGNVSVNGVSGTYDSASGGWTGSPIAGQPDGSEVVVNGNKEFGTDSTRVPGAAPWDPKGQGGYYEISPAESKDIMAVQSKMVAHIQARPGGSNRKTGLHPYTNNPGNIANLPNFTGGQWYSASVPGGDGGRKLMINSADPNLFFYSPEHYEYFIPGYVDQE